MEIRRRVRFDPAPLCTWGGCVEALRLANTKKARVLCSARFSRVCNDELRSAPIACRPASEAWSFFLLAAFRGKKKAVPGAAIDTCASIDIRGGGPSAKDPGKCRLCAWLQQMDFAYRLQFPDPFFCHFRYLVLTTFPFSSCFVEPPRSDAPSMLRSAVLCFHPLWSTAFPPRSCDPCDLFKPLHPPAARAAGAALGSRRLISLPPRAVFGRRSRCDLRPNLVSEGILRRLGARRCTRAFSLRPSRPSLFLPLRSNRSTPCGARAGRSRQGCRAPHCAGAACPLADFAQQKRADWREARLSVAILSSSLSRFTAGFGRVRG